VSDAGGEPTPPIRIGTAERNAALKALDAHLEAGRLDAMEYGERSAHVAEARTADELRPLFADLPAPHPDLPGVSTVTERSGVVSTPGSASPARRRPAAIQTWGPRIAAVMPFVALVLFLAVPWSNSWVFFLLIPAAGVLFAGSRDDDQGHHDGHRGGRSRPARTPARARRRRAGPGLRTTLGPAIRSSPSGGRGCLMTRSAAHPGPAGSEGER
jgi:hypothetical protein